MDSDKKQEVLKLREGILTKKKTNTTTPTSSWKLVSHNQMNTNSISARKMGANLWELDHAGSHDMIHHHRRKHRSQEKEKFKISDKSDEELDSDDSQPTETETTLRRSIREKPGLHNLSVGKKGQDLQQVSSASCCSSMQVTPYACVVTPTRYTLKTSTHFLKVLNRIWTLEEQHASNKALIKTLKRDLDISQAQVKTLIEERKSDHQELDELKKSTHERKEKGALSTEDELLDIKSSYMREKKARILLESLCDEFAKGIKDYEEKVRFLQQNRGKKDKLMSKKGPDRLILHVSEAWLDERVQIKSDFPVKTLISDNLSSEIETFLEAKKKQDSRSVADDDNIVENREENTPYDVIIETSSKQGREGVKANTLMAKLLEARLESQFAKSKTVRR